MLALKNKEEGNKFSKISSRFFGLNNKRGLSNVIAYALLIVMTIALSTVVFSWLQLYVGETEIAECPDGVDLVIKEYICKGNNLNVTIKNQGRFSVEGYRIRVDDRSGAESGFYLLIHDVNGADGVFLSPGDEVRNKVFDFTKACNDGCPNGITIAEVQPIYDEDGERVACKSDSAQEIDCSGTPIIVESTCGNGDREPRELCDDGNTANGDGCNLVCEVEGGGWSCSGEPSVCNLIPVGSTCGNNILEGSEQCDDGNRVDNDGCSNTCTIGSVETPLVTDCSIGKNENYICIDNVIGKVGENFLIPIRVFAQDAEGVDIFLSYDETKLEIIGDLILGNVGSSFGLPIQNINNLGRIVFTAANVEKVSMQGILFYINGTITSDGINNIRFSEVSFDETAFSPVYNGTISNPF